ncbi:MAG TPA: M48 family metalloprotease [Candidatus Pacearchaeota archaeon]|jgi:heat shock protein HtpX|nr:M48 family metalloprotease [Candidatus Pacearchaeota archaeon]
MANLYTQSESNIRRTWIYLFFFALFVIGIGWVISYFLETQAILWIAVVLAVLSNIVSYWYSDKIVLNMVKAQPIKKDDNPELYRLVENLSITAGLPMPKIYIMNEMQPNAFATGRDPEHGVVVVTQGLLDILDRVELEGVLAHELAHIGNRDILLSTAVVVLVGIVVSITDMFFRMAFFSNGDNKNKGPMIIIAIPLAILAPIMAQLMKLAISRRREFLADSSGALLTRYPDGLARALEKISQNQYPMKRANNATAHLFISSPFKGKESVSWLSKMFMTHPPTEERIAKLRDMSL